MKHELTPPPDKLVQNGSIVEGLFSSPIRNFNFRDEIIEGNPILRAIRPMRLKQWLGFGIIHPEWYMTVFVLETKIASSAMVYAYDRVNDRRYKHERTWPGAPQKIAMDLCDDTCLFKGSGLQVKMRNHADAGEHHIQASARGAVPNKPPIEMDVTLEENLEHLTPLVASFRLINGNHAVTHKAPMPARGHVRIGDQDVELDPARDIAIMDEHKSYLPYQTTWRWSTFAGYDSQNRLVCLNLGDHDTVDDPEWGNENCAWIDGKIHLLGPLKLEFNRSRTREPWTIIENSGRVRAEFIPQGINEQKVNLGIISMDYFQLSGSARGFVIDDAGDRIDFDDFYGVAESMNARF